MADKSIELVEGLIVKPATHGRRTYSRQAKRALVQMCKASGVSVAGLALSHGINANLLRRWISQHDATEPASSAESRAALLPVTTTPAKAPAREQDCQGSIEIVFACDGPGQRLRGSTDIECGAGAPGTQSVIALPVGTRIWLAAGVTDMRRGMYGLAALVQTVLLENVYGGHVFVFRGRKAI
jgi:transposase-like protein